jgi:hypothetical protein
LCSIATHFHVPVLCCAVLCCAASQVLHGKQNGSAAALGRPSYLVSGCLLQYIMENLFRDLLGICAACVAHVWELLDP